MRIDAHQHFWTPQRGDYPWLTPDLMPLYREFAPDDLAPIIARHRIDRTILIQAAPTEAETDFLLALARNQAFIAGVVGWVDLAGSGAPDRLAERAREHGFVGIRPMLQDLSDPDWIADPALTPALDVCTTLGLRFDALVRPPQLPALLRMAERHPALRIVIDHGGKPPIGRDLSGWTASMTAIARLPNCHCKLSGLAVEIPGKPTLAAIRAVVVTLLDLFGPERLIWGSDWPLSLLAISYDDWMEWSEALLADCTPAEQSAVFGGNAQRFYGVDDE